MIPLITLAVVTQFSTESGPLWLRIAFGAVAGVVFFFAIFIRELILSLLALSKGIAVRSVTLFAFGGLREVDEATSRPSNDVILAVGGLCANLIIAGIFFVIHTLLASSAPMAIDAMLQWLAFLCFTLALFHFIPSFPLDGGLVFRAILWKVLDNNEKATRIASWISWTIGILIVFGGVFLLVFTVERFTGAFLVAIGLILQNAATRSRKQPRSAVS